MHYLYVNELDMSVFLPVFCRHPKTFFMTSYRQPVMVDLALLLHFF